MNKIFIVFFFFNINYVFSQEPIIEESNQIKVIYKLNNALLKDYKTEVFLYCNEESSQYVHYRSAKTEEVDGVRYTLGYVNIVDNFDYNTNIIEEQRTLEDGTVLFATWKNDIFWEITDEEKNIGEFKVRKAITPSIEGDVDNPLYSGNAIAWFCPDIPIPSGPGRYYGLPGLILELTFDLPMESYSFAGIETLSNTKLISLNKENLVEKEDVIFYEHKNQDKIKEIRKKNKKKK